MRIFTTKWFTRFSKKKDIANSSLCGAVADVENGYFDADLGGGVYKQRLARQGKGKSGGFRIIVCLRKGERTFIVYGFSKSEQANVSPEETVAFKKMAEHLFTLTDTQIDLLIQDGELREITMEKIHE